MKPVVLFGDGLVARLAHFYLSHDSDHKVAAFTVDANHLTTTELLGLPVLPFEELRLTHPPELYDMFVAVGYGRMNKFREEKYLAAKELGYDLINYISSHAVTWPDLEIGDNCFIMEQNILQPFVTVGNNVTMWGGSHVGHDSVIGDHCFIASHTVISGQVTIGPNCFLGVNSTIRDMVRVERECLVGAGVVVSKNTKERQVLVAQKPVLAPITSDRLPHP